MSRLDFNTFHKFTLAPFLGPLRLILKPSQLQNMFGICNCIRPLWSWTIFDRCVLGAGSRRGSHGSDASSPKSPKEKKITDGESKDANHHHHPVGTVTVEMTPPAQVNQAEKQEV